MKDSRYASRVQTPQAPSRSVEHSGTMSSFLKARGKDKYSRSRLREIDVLLNQALPREAPEDMLRLAPANPGVPHANIIGSCADEQSSSHVRELAAALEASTDIAGGSSSSSAAPAPADGRLLGGRGLGPGGLLSPPPSRRGAREAEAAMAAQMAVYVQRIPQFHKSRAKKATAEADASMQDSEQLSRAASPCAGSLDRAPATEGNVPEQAEETAAAATAHPQLPRMVSSGGASSFGGDCSPSRRNERRGNAVASGRSRAAVFKKKKIRDLDPHLDIHKNVPTQRMHGNWPDSLKRQIAMHFYQMTPARILEEEEKERLWEEQQHRHRKAAAEDAADENADQDEDGGLQRLSSSDAPSAIAVPLVPSTSFSAGASPKQVAQRNALERTLARGAEGGFVAHGLEVRIRNGPWSERVVVGRHTAVPRGARRPCQLLTKLQTEKKKLSVKY